MQTSSSVLSTRTGTRRGRSGASTPSRRASPATTGALLSNIPSPSSSAVDPDSLNPDTDPDLDQVFQVNPDSDPGIRKM